MKKKDHGALRKHVSARRDDDWEEELPHAKGFFVQAPLSTVMMAQRIPLGEEWTIVVRRIEGGADSNSRSSEAPAGGLIGA